MCLLVEFFKIKTTLRNLKIKVYFPKIFHIPYVSKFKPLSNIKNFSYTCKGNQGIFQTFPMIMKN